jgi:hypothetical protein
MGLYHPEYYSTEIYQGFVNRAYFMIGWDMPYILTEYQRAMQVFDNTMGGLTYGVPLEIAFKSLISLGKQIGFDIKERLSIPRPETVRKLFKLTQELAIKNKGPPESSAELSTQELLEDAKKQKLIKSLKKKKSELKQQTAALEDAVKALALTNAQQSEAETSGAENSGAQSSSARPKLTWEEIQADRRERMG